MPTADEVSADAEHAARPDHRRVETDENVRLAYGQLCASYQAIDDFRLRLLGLLPVGTGVFLVLPELVKSSHSPPA